MSQDVFQHKMDEILEKCKGCVSIADDAAIHGPNNEEHDRINLHNLMQVAQEHGLVFNPDKCEIRKEQIQFYGLYFNANGVHPDPHEGGGCPEHVTAIQQTGTAAVPWHHHTHVPLHTKSITAHSDAERACKTGCRA